MNKMIYTSSCGLTLKSCYLKGKDATYRVSEDKVKGIHQHETIHVKMKISPQFGEEKAPKHRKLSDLASHTDEDTNPNKIEYDSITFTKVGD